MIATEPMFLETLTPSTRKVLVFERVAAMRGQLQEVCTRLNVLIASTPSDNRADLVALGLLWCELLHLDRQDEEALSVFKRVLEPNVSLLPTAAQLVVTGNLSLLQLAELQGVGVSTFYHLVDRQRVAQFETSESDSLLAAQSAIDRGRLTEALPHLWRNYLRAYTLGSWRASRWSAERLAKLYLRAGALELACHHLLVAEDEKGMEELADAAARRGDPDVIQSILHRLVEFANLRRHFIVACKFVACIPDLIPNSEVEQLVEWLLPRCHEMADRNGGGAMAAAWKALSQLGHRLSQDTSRKAIEAAITHPEWLAPLPGENRVPLSRKVMVEAVTFLSHSTSKDDLPTLASATLPLATERIQDFDYPAVINLLCNLRGLGGNALREMIKTALYVSGKPVSRILAQVAGDFGVEALDTARWEQFADKMVEETRLTVQRVTSGKTAKPVPETLMTMTSGELQITIGGGTGLQALIQGQKHLSDATVERIVRVLIEMATHEDNVLSNREHLLSLLCGFADRATPALCEEVVHTLEPLARGIVPESENYLNSAAGHDPLASARMSMGTPDQVQAMALIAAATYCGSDATRSRLIGETLFEGFVSPHVSVRRGAYAAARRLPKLSTEQLLPILMGLRDPEPDAAIAAFAAFAERTEWPLTRPMWKLFLLATRLASQSPNPNLRRHAALSLRARLGDAPTEGTRSEARAIMEVFSGDVAYSVREAVIG